MYICIHYYTFQHACIIPGNTFHRDATAACPACTAPNRGVEPTSAGAILKKTSWVDSFVAVLAGSCCKNKCYIECIHNICHISNKSIYDHIRSI